MKKQGEKKQREKKLEAYFTVEAALLLPFVIGTIVYIIYFQFFWYNRCLMDQETAMTGIRAVQAGHSDREEIKREISLWKKEFLTDKYVGWKSEEPVLSCQKNRFTISREGGLPVYGSSWNSKVVYQNKIIPISTILRQYRKIMLQTEENG